MSRPSHPSALLLLVLLFISQLALKDAASHIRRESTPHNDASRNRGDRRLSAGAATIRPYDDSLKARLKSAREEANRVANLIYQRFEFHDFNHFQFFLESANMPTYGWDLLKYKFAKKLLTADSQFLMIFGGSSVTAGHDNYYNQSYPMVVERRLQKLFDILQVKLLVHNIAQGANNCRPSNYCYEAMGGSNADFIGWEQSFNCGRARDIFEFIARVAYWHGAVIYYSASGAFNPTGCAPSTDPIPWISEAWTPEAAGVTTTPYVMTKDIVRDYRKLQNDWFDDGNSVSRFTSIYGPLYKGVGPHGFSVWGHSSSLCHKGNQTGCTAIDMVGECQQKGGKHWMVGEAGTYSRDGGKGKDWHPTWGMHLLRAEVLVYNYLHIFVDAMNLVEDTFANRSISDPIAYFDEEYNKLRIPIPENRGLYCAPQECKHNPICFTNYEPHFNPKFKLDSIILGALEGWQLHRRAGSWADDGGEAKDHDAKYGYRDKRPVYEAKGGGHDLHLQIHNVRSNGVRVCSYSHRDGLKHVIFLLEPDVTLLPLAEVEAGVAAGVQYPGQKVKYTPSDKRMTVTNRKDVGDDCVLLNEVPNGNSVLTIRTDPEHVDHAAIVSHLVIF